MNADTLQTIKPAAVQDGEYLVALGYIAMPIGTGNWAVFHLLRDVIRHCLAQCGIQAQPAGVVNPVTGPSTSGLILSRAVVLAFTVPNLAPATAALRPLIDQLGNHRSGLAYYRADSKRWHTIHGVHFDYDLALTDACMNVASAELERHCKANEELLAYCQNLLRDLESQNPEGNEVE